MERLKNEEFLPKKPTVFLCAGVSGAGCSTACRNIQGLHLAEIAPPQFTTRPLRGIERRGEQYYSISANVLEKVPQQIAIKAERYGNTYGFFWPTIYLMRKIAASKNIMVDAENSPEEWGNLLGTGTNLISLFFAPKDPSIAGSRVIERANRTGDVISKEELRRRLSTNAFSIERVLMFDYWIDSTDTSMVIPAVVSVIKTHSYNVEEYHPRAIKVQEKPEAINQLIVTYRQSAQ